MKKFHIVGAFDRHNYGDILFPLIHTRYIQSQLNENEYEINYYAITEADLTSCGGVITKSIKDLLEQKLQTNDHIIMSGGDILGVDWPTMVGHVSNSVIYLALKIMRKLFPFSVANSLVKIFGGYKNEFPYVISNAVTNAKVYYTCVGGSGFIPKLDRVHLQRVCKELIQSERISVREKDIQASLEKYDVKCDLVPDCALLMSDLYPKLELSKRNWHHNIELTNNFKLDCYFVFQAGRAYIEKYINEIIDQLQTVQTVTGMSVLLLPIGRATGHEDDVVLRKLFSNLKDKGCHVGIQNSENILDIMASLAFSKTYVGTSLHGAISSYSFGNKVCGFSTGRVKKLGSFLKTWMKKGDYITIEGIEFSSDFIHMVSDSTSLIDNAGLDAQKKLIYSDLNNYI